MPQVNLTREQIQNDYMSFFKANGNGFLELFANGELPIKPGSNADKKIKDFLEQSKAAKQQGKKVPAEAAQSLIQQLLAEEPAAIDFAFKAQGFDNPGDERKRLQQLASLTIPAAAPASVGNGATGPGVGDSLAEGSSKALEWAKKHPVGAVVVAGLGLVGLAKGKDIFTGSFMDKIGAVAALGLLTAVVPIVFNLFNNQNMRFDNGPSRPSRERYEQGPEQFERYNGPPIIGRNPVDVPRVYEGKLTGRRAVQEPG